MEMKIFDNDEGFLDNPNNILKKLIMCFHETNLNDKFIPE